MMKAKNRGEKRNNNGREKKDRDPQQGEKDRRGRVRAPVYAQNRF